MTTSSRGSSRTLLLELLTSSSVASLEARDESSYHVTVNLNNAGHIRKRRRMYSEDEEDLVADWLMYLLSIKNKEELTNELTLLKTKRENMRDWPGKLSLHIIYYIII